MGVLGLGRRQTLAWFQPQAHNTLSLQACLQNGLQRVICSPLGLLEGTTGQLQQEGSESDWNRAFTEGGLKLCVQRDFRQPLGIS